MLILEGVHLNALQKWIVGRLQVGITCEQQKKWKRISQKCKKKHKNNKKLGNVRNIKSPKCVKTSIKSRMRTLFKCVCGGGGEGGRLD